MDEDEAENDVRDVSEVGAVVAAMLALPLEVRIENAAVAF